MTTGIIRPFTLKDWHPESPVSEIATIDYILNLKAEISVPEAQNCSLTLTEFLALQRCIGSFDLVVKSSILIGPSGGSNYIGLVCDHVILHELYRAIDELKDYWNHLTIPTMNSDGVIIKVNSTLGTAKSLIRFGDILCSQFRDECTSCLTEDEMFETHCSFKLEKIIVEMAPHYLLWRCCHQSS